MNFEKQAIWNQPVIFEKGQKGLRNNQLPELPNELKSYVDRQLDKISKVKRITELKLPEVGELEVLRHYTRLSQMNFGVTTGFYPLGSCT
ncbi:MAG: aminomethyl-transferring glycine dehydrogenase subunit GcvPB, partial [Candidatus Hodarchaeales archaeon]